MTNLDCDIAVIGAGIHGAGVAQAAAAAGYQVLILEREDAVGQATSSRSSKLIHGGLRYLETGQFSLVRECLNERGLLLRLAPRLVRLKPFHIPIYADTRRSPAFVRLGLGLYAALGGLRRDTRFRLVRRCDWESLDGLNTTGLRAVFRYYDAQTDDADLTRAVIASAQRLGAELITRSEVTGIRLGSPQQEIQTVQDGRKQTLRARVVVNATGPWVNHLLERVFPLPDPTPIDLVAGTHVVIEGTLEHGAFYVEAPRDGRGVFVLPWKGKTLIGTTERVHEGSPDSVAPTEEEIEYLLSTYRHYFPGKAPVLRERFAGLRVLPRGDRTPFRRSRETTLVVDRSERPRLVSVCGGKLTAYRLTGERVIRRILPSLPAAEPRADTRELTLE